MAETTTKKPSGPRFRIRTRVRGFERRKFPPFNGIPFVNGEGFTDSEELADHFAAECQCEVTDTRTGKVRNPLPDTVADEAAAEEERKRTAKK